MADLFGTRERRRGLCDALHITFLVCRLHLVSVRQRGSIGMAHINELLCVRQRQLTSQRLFEGLLPSLHIWKRDKLAYMHPGIHIPVGGVEEPSLRKSAIWSVVAKVSGSERSCELLTLGQPIQSHHHGSRRIQASASHRLLRTSASGRKCHSGRNQGFILLTGNQLPSPLTTYLEVLPQVSTDPSPG